MQVEVRSVRVKFVYIFALSAYLTLMDPSYYPLISVRGASIGARVQIKAHSVRVNVRGGGSKLGSLVLIPDHVSQVTGLIGQCEGADIGARVWKKVRSVRIESRAVNFSFY